MQPIRAPRPNAFTTLGAFNTLFDQLFDAPVSPSEAREAGFRPPVNITEDGESLHLEVELPGLQKDDIHLDPEDGRLTLRAERPKPELGEDVTAYRSEFRYGVFRRAFVLPREIDSNGIEAAYSNGVLRVRLRKREQATKNRIEIQD